MQLVKEIHTQKVNIDSISPITSFDHYEDCINHLIKL